MSPNKSMYKNNFFNLKKVIVKNRTKLRLFIPSSLLHAQGPDRLDHAGWKIFS